MSARFAPDTPRNGMDLKKAGIGAGAVALIGLVIACSSGGDTSGPGADSDSGGGGDKATHGKATGHTVVWKATSSAGNRVDVTYGLGGDTSQANGVSTPWTKTTRTKDDSITASLMVQNKGSSGDVTCTITVDGKVVKTNKSSGEYAVVDCNYDHF